MSVKVVVDGYCRVCGLMFSLTNVSVELVVDGYCRVCGWRFSLTNVSVEIVVDEYCRVCEVEVFSYQCECRGSGRWVFQSSLPWP